MPIPPVSVPAQYVAANLAESWEFPDASTYIVHLRKGIHWQDIAPVSGREFTADDVTYTYGRLFGVSGGFTKGSPYLSSASRISEFAVGDRH
jgi:ABC-type transport system substrate-binding protein